jgi:HEAT repeat protein
VVSSNEVRNPAPRNANAHFYCDIAVGMARPRRTAPRFDNTISEVGGRTFRQWLDDLKSPDACVREEAIRALVNFGHDAPRAVPQIIERLQDPDASPRVRAAIALGVIPISKEDMPKAARALGQRVQEDRHSMVRYYAATTLVALGEDARYGQAGLVQGVSDTATWEIRHACVCALRVAGHDASGGPAPLVEHALISALHDPTYRVRLEAILTIGSLGKPQDRTLLLSVLQGLKERNTDREPGVRVWAHVAMMVLDEVTDQSVQSVIKYLKHADPKVRVEAARALGAVATKLKAKFSMIEPALIGALQDKEASVLAAVAQALTEMDELSGKARAELLDLLKHPDPAVRAAVAQSFGNAAAKAHPAVPVLAELVQDKEQPPAVVMSACWAIGEIGDPSAAAETALTSIVQRKDVDESLKQSAQFALDQIHKLKR